QAILRALGDFSRVIRLPANVLEKLQKYHAAASSLAQKVGHTPSVDAVAEEAGLSPSLASTLMASSRRPLSLDEPLEEGDADAVRQLIGDDRTASPTLSTRKTAVHDRLHELLGTLLPREQEILRIRRISCSRGSSVPRSSWRRSWTAVFRVERVGLAVRSSPISWRTASASPSSSGSSSDSGRRDEAISVDASDGESPASSATASTEGVWPTFWASDDAAAWYFWSFSSTLAGRRITREKSPSARRIAWWIHQIAYVENLKPRLWRNRSAARMRPVLPSWTRSGRERPR